MGDPLSVAAGVAGLVSLGLQTTEYLIRYYAKYKDRSSSLARTTNRLESLLISLRFINDSVQKRKWRADEQDILRHIETSILSCEDIVSELEEEAKKFKKQPEDSIVKAIKKTGRNAAYPLRESTLVKLTEDVNALQSNLSTALESLHFKSYENTQDEIHEIRAIITNAHAQTVAADLRQWLNAPDATVDYNSACSKRHAATGSWFVKSEHFKTWLQQDNSFLWLHGFAGCGKSVLCSTAIQLAFRHQRAQSDGAVAFFFFTFNDETKQDTAAMLRALLLQLCGQVAGSEGDLLKLKQSYNNGTPPNSILQEYLRQAVSRAGHVFIMLDALDECPDDDQRREVLLSTIQAMRAWKLASLHLLVTSRDHPDIRQALSPTMMTQLALKGEGVAQDIDEFVTYHIENDVKLRRWGGHCEMIKQHLVKHAGGVFRWVECQLGTLRRCLQSEKHLKKCLQSLPRTLDATYERMLCGISEDYKDEALRLLTLLCFSYRPLSVIQIVDALAVDLDENCYDSANQLTGSDDLLQICTGLIDLDDHYDNHDNHDNHDDDDNANDNDNNNCIDKMDRLDPHDTLDTDQMLERQIYVRIAHFSVQEYLLSHRIIQSPAKAFSLTASTGNAQLSKTCLIYLCNQDFVHQPLTPNLLNQYPFAKYAARFWYDHYRKSDPIVITELDTWSYSLLVEEPLLNRYVRLCDPESLWQDEAVFEPATINCASPPYYAALLGLENVISRMLSDGRTKVITHGVDYGNVLQAASKGGYLGVVRLLLEHGADVNGQGGGEYSNALQTASYFGHLNVVRLLLEHGVDVNGQGGGEYSNTLWVASYYGHLDVVRLLLEHGADVNGRGGGEVDNALWAASYCGHLDVVRLLLEHGVDVNGQGGGEYGNALQAAISYGHPDIVRLLLEHGADVDGQGGKYGNALWAASYHGHLDVVRLLLEHDAEYKTALQASSRGGHLEVVQMLNDKGLDIECVD